MRSKKFHSMVRMWFQRFLSDPLLALVCLDQRELNLNTPAMEEALDALLAMAEG